MANLQISPPDVFFVAMFFDPSGVGYVDNQIVNLPKKYTRCKKISTTLSSVWPINNIFLHFNPFIDSQTANTTIGRLLCLGGQPNVFPLEWGAGIAKLYTLKFDCGFPLQVYLSGDYQGDGAHRDMFIFYNEGVDIDIEMTP